MQWTEKIAQAEKHFSPWRENGKKITERFRGKQSVGYTDQIDYNIHHANGQLYISMVYPRTPLPVARRKNAPQGLSVAEALEKTLRFVVDQYDIDEVIEPTMLDYYNTALGQVIVNYVPYFKKVPTKKRLVERGGVFRDDKGNEYDDVEFDEEGGFVADSEEQFQYEEIQFETIPWDRFGYDPDALIWDDVEWAYIEYHFSESRFEGKFGKKKAALIAWDARRDEESYVGKRARVFRVFDKVNRQEIWVAEGYEGEIEKRDDPWGLEGFFPFPPPLMGTVTSDKFIPVPQYQIMEPLYQELDEVQARIFNIMSAIKVRGVYNGSYQEQLGDLLNQDDNALVPIEGWTQFQGEGGLEKQLSMLPLGDLIAALTTLSNQRNIIRQQIDEMTPFFDAARGGGRAEESAAMTKAKTRYSDARVNREIKKVNKFIRNLYRIAGEMVGELFSAETISQIIGEPFTEQELASLRDDINRNILVDVEIDMDAWERSQGEQKELSAFLNALASAAQLIPVLQQSGIDGRQIIERVIASHPAFRDIEGPNPLAPSQNPGAVSVGQGGNGAGPPQAQ